MKLLIISPSWLGDIVMSQSLLIAIKQQYPNAIIDVLAPKWSHAILDMMPEVNANIEFNNKPGKLELGDRFKLSKSIRDKDYQQAIILPNSFKSALIPWLAKIPVRTGWLGELRYGLINDIRILNKKKLPLMASRYAALAYNKQDCYQIKTPKPKITIDNQQLSNMQQHFNFTNKPIFAVCPGAAFGNAKQWPAKYHTKIVEYMLDNSWQVILLGTENDKKICDLILHNIDDAYKKNIHNLAGQTTLQQVIYLLYMSNLVISNDSGLMHVAATLRKPQIAIFGPTTPKHSPPLNDNAKIILAENIECSPCHKKVCPLQHHNCMQQLQPDQVIRSLPMLINMQDFMAK